MAALSALRGVPPAALCVCPVPTRQTAVNQRLRQRSAFVLRSAAAAPGLPRSSSGGGGGGGSSFGGSGGDGGSTGQPARQHGRRSHMVDPQPQLQAWLQQEHGLSEEDADLHARRLVRVFDGDEAAALASVPATFGWCRSQGLSGLQTAQILDNIAFKRLDKVVGFAETAQRDWQLIDGYIAAHLRRQQGEGGGLPKHASLGSLLAGTTKATRALSMAPGHVAAWLEEMDQHFEATDLGAMLMAQVQIVSSRAASATAVIEWVACELGAKDTASFFKSAPTLLQSDLSSLRSKLVNLQQQLVGLTAEQARQLAVKWPKLLTVQETTVQRAAAWLHSVLPTPEQLWAALNAGPQLLGKPVEQLQGNADVLQQRLNWSPDRVAAHIQAYPQAFADVDLSGPDTAAKLLLLTDVLGAPSTEQCIAEYGNYLRRSLEAIGAGYTLVQRLKPSLLHSRNGGVAVSWIANNRKGLVPNKISPAAYAAHFQEWPVSEEGQGLLAGLRSGSTAGWPRPGAPPAVQPARKVK